MRCIVAATISFMRGSLVSMCLGGIREGIFANCPYCDIDRMTYIEASFNTLKENLKEDLTLDQKQDLITYLKDKKTMKFLMESWRNYLNEEEELRKKVIFMAGAPGAGKSTVIEKLGLGDIEIINPDEFYEPALEKCGLGKDIKKIKQDFLAARNELKDILKDVLYLQEPEDGWKHKELMQMFQDASRAVGDDRSYIYNLETTKEKYDEEREKIVAQANCFNQAQRDAKEKQSRIADEGRSFIVDGTGGRFAVIKNQKDQLEASGYDVAMIFVDIPLETAIDRQESRGLEGGRTLDPTAIEKSWAAVNKNVEPYQELFSNNFFHIIAADEMCVGGGGGVGVVWSVVCEWCLGGV